MKISSIKTNSYPQTKILFPQEKATMPKMNQLNFGDRVEFHKPEENKTHTNKVIEKFIDILKLKEDPNFELELVDEYVQGEVDHIGKLTRDIYFEQKKNYPEAKRFLRYGQKGEFAPVKLGIFRDAQLLEFSDFDSTKNPKTGVMKVSDKDKEVLVEYELKDGLNSYTVNDFTGYPTIRTTQLQGKNPTYYKSVNIETGREIEIEFLPDDVYTFKEKSHNPTSGLIDYSRVLFADANNADNCQYIEYNEETRLYESYVINPETDLWEMEYEGNNAQILFHTKNL